MQVKMNYVICFCADSRYTTKVFEKLYYCTFCVGRLVALTFSEFFVEEEKIYSTTACMVDDDSRCTYLRSYYYVNIKFIYFAINLNDRIDHTIMTAPLPVRSAKLSMIWLG